MAIIRFVSFAWLLSLQKIHPSKMGSFKAKEYQDTKVPFLVSFSGGHDDALLRYGVPPVKMKEIR